MATCLFSGISSIPWRDLCAKAADTLAYHAFYTSIHLHDGHHRGTYHAKNAVRQHWKAMLLSALLWTKLVSLALGHWYASQVPPAQYVDVPMTQWPRDFLASPPASMPTEVVVDGVWWRLLEPGMETVERAWWEGFGSAYERKRIQAQRKEMVARGVVKVKVEVEEEVMQPLVLEYPRYVDARADNVFARDSTDADSCPSTWDVSYLNGSEQKGIWAAEVVYHIGTQLSSAKPCALCYEFHW